jgi:hypothetical protein
MADRSDRVQLGSDEAKQRLKDTIRALERGDYSGATIPRLDPSIADEVLGLSWFCCCWGSDPAVAGSMHTKQHLLDTPKTCAQSIPWGLAYQLAVQKEAARIPLPVSLPPQGWGGHRRAGDHAGPASLLAARATGSAVNSTSAPPGPVTAGSRSSAPSMGKPSEASLADRVRSTGSPTSKGKEFAGAAFAAPNGHDAQSSKLCWWS